MEVNQVQITYDELVNLMIEHCLKPNPTAEKLKEVIDSLLKVKPEVKNLSDHFVGRAFGVAKAHFRALKSSEVPPLKPLEVMEGTPEGLKGALSVTSKPQQGLPPPGSPVQINFNIGKDGSPHTSEKPTPSNSGSEGTSDVSRGTSKVLAEQAKALRALAKRTSTVCKTMIQKDVTYLGLLSAVEMVAGKDGRGLVERVSALIIDLMRTSLPAELICVRLTGDFGVDFRDLVDAFLGLADDSGDLPKGYEKVKLPKNLNIKSEKTGQNGSETPSKEGTSSPQQVPQSIPRSLQQGTVSPQQVSEWAEAAIN